MSLATRLTRSSIQDVKKSLIDKKLTVKQLCQQSINSIRETNYLNIYTTVCETQAKEFAQQSDDRYSTAIDKRTVDERVRALEGIPISIKDNICTKDIPTTCASKMLQNFTPTYDAHVVKKLKNAGAIIVGKTNMDEFAMGSSGTTSCFGPTANCWQSFDGKKFESEFSHNLFDNIKPSVDNKDHWYMAGGSSTGSAVSVASGTAFASIGTDTGGSTRQPASLTGTVGYKPSYGVISRFGLIPLVHALDVISILARTVDDVARVFQVVAGEDCHDLTSINFKTLLNNSTFDNTHKTIKIGIPEDFILKGNIDNDTAKALDEAVRVLKESFVNESRDCSIEFKKVDLNHSHFATECYAIIACSEIASNMACYDGFKYGLMLSSKNGEDAWIDILKRNRNEGFGCEVKKRILLGNYFLLSSNREKYFERALKVRKLISDGFAKTFNESQIDILITPSTPTSSINYSQWLYKQENNQLFNEDFYLIPANLANLPSISIPIKLNDKVMPVGIQLIANKYHDIDLLYVARLLETAIFKSNMSVPQFEIK